MRTLTGSFYLFRRLSQTRSIYEIQCSPKYADCLLCSEQGISKKHTTSAWDRFLDQKWELKCFLLVCAHKNRQGSKNYFFTCWKINPLNLQTESRVLLCNMYKNNKILPYNQKPCYPPNLRSFKQSKMDKIGFKFYHRQLLSVMWTYHTVTNSTLQIN